MKTRLLLRIVLGALLILTFTSVVAQDAVVLTFWNGFTASDRPFLEAIVQEFNDTHPDIQVEMDIQPWDIMFQKLLPSWASGGEPDLAAMSYNIIPQYVESEILAPLDDFYTDYVDEANFSDAALNGMTVGGHRYGVPMISFGLMLFYNKDMFEAAGLDPEAPPTTWEEWQAAIVALSKDEDGDGTYDQYGLVWGDHAAPNIWPALIWGGGGDFISDDSTTSLLDDPLTVEAVQSWSELLFLSGRSPLGLSGVEADNLMITGKAAMEISGPWMINAFASAGLNFGIAQVPAGPAGQFTQGDALYMVLGSSSPNKEAAYEFLRFWQDEWAQVYWSQNVGFPPVRADLADHADIVANPYVTAFAESGPYQRIYLPGLLTYTELNDDIIMPAILEVARGEKPADEALQEAAVEMNEVLSE
jgi:multiple sugar transport system substrate-binding protein